MNYLIDEASNTGKGGNTIISLLHHFLATHGFGEVSVHFHADNCCGQNKNRFLMYYLMWKIRVGLHQEIKISFLPVGHTKFSPDWCFMKQQYRKTNIGCLDDIVAAVNSSEHNWWGHKVVKLLCLSITGVNTSISTPPKQHLRASNECNTSIFSSFSWTSKGDE